jgi:adenine-specific DNA-methyltransferase
MNDDFYILGTSMEFSQRSHEMNARLPKDLRKANGIYFTPKSIRHRIFAKLQEWNIQPKSILEPSFGSGEFLEDVRQIYPSAVLHGVEKNPDLFASVSAENLICSDFLAYRADPVDLIVGNPPYFVTKQKDPRCMKGRGNIFVQFIYKCLSEHLSPNGILAFVLPTSFYNCGYYEPCRRYILETCTVRHVENVEGSYYETQQQTMILIVQKKPSSDHPFFLERGGAIYLTPFYRELRTLLDGSLSLSEIGWTVKTGEVVWNQEKDKLADSGDLIIYSGNIIDNKLVIGNPGKDKKQYIQNFKGSLCEGPALVVARGYGNTSYTFHFAVVKEGISFYGENHVNVIRATAQSKVTLEQIVRSFQNVKTNEFLRMFVGNGALSKTELETVLPIFLN